MTKTIFYVYPNEKTLRLRLAPAETMIRRKVLHDDNFFQHS